MDYFKPCFNLEIFPAWVRNSAAKFSQNIDQTLSHPVLVSSVSLGILYFTGFNRSKF